MLRSNVFFMLSKVKGRGKTIFVTSTTSGEGKSFISLNFNLDKPSSYNSNSNFNSAVKNWPAVCCKSFLT